jgi:hypothetical protein
VSRSLAALSLAALSAMPAFAQSDRPSEDALFGGPPTPAPVEAPSAAPDTTVSAPPSAAPAAAPSAGDTRGDALFGDVRTEVRRNPELDADKLALGGKLLLRGQTQLYTDTSAGDQPLSSPNLLDVYLDARPSDRVRAYVEYRLNYDPTTENGRAAIPDYCPETPPAEDPGNVECLAGLDALRRGFAPSATSSTLSQLWLKFDIAQRVYLTIGKQPIRWGAGQIWNPTDFVNRTKRDPLSTLDLRTGVSLVKVHVPFEASTSNLYALAILDDSRTLGQVGGAVRGEIAFDRAEVTVSAAARKDQPLLLGGDVSMGVGLFDLYAEGAFAHGHHTPLPGEPDRDDDWIPQVSAGTSVQIDYGDEDSMTLGLEYFHNDDGVDDPAKYGNALAAGRSFFDLPKNAAGFFFLAIAPGTLDDSSIFATAIANLDDRSGTVRLQWSQRALTWLTVMPYVGGYFGERGDLLRPSGYDPFTSTPTQALLTAEAGLWLSLAL